MGKHKQRLKKIVDYHGSLIEHTKPNKAAYIIFIFLNIACFGTILWCSLERRWQGVFFAVLAMILLLIPPFVKKTFRCELPTVLESIAYFFVFCAEILGEIGSFYTKVPFWDTMLHTVCGFIFAAFGFCLFDILNENRKSKFELSPMFLTLLAFCFSITVGTLWEFFEFSMDMLTVGDMQKDWIITDFGTVALDPDGLNKVVQITDIEKTLIYTESGVVEIEGYLDIGLIDTMKDMLVNFAGAFVFSIFGYIYVKTRGKQRFARQFIPVLMDKSEQTASESEDIGEGTDEVPEVTEENEKSEESEEAINN